MEFMTFLKDNFMHVAPILTAGIFAVAIIAERAKTLYQTYSLNNSEGFLERLRELVSKSRVNDAMALCQQHSGKPIAEVAKVGIERANQPEELIMNAIELSRNRWAEKIQKRTSYLATIANVATLLGLLGTIAGLIESFAAVGHADAQQKAAMLANGIATAMNATMLGLGVAIPCMVIFSLYINKANRLVAELEEAGITVLDAIQVASYGVPSDDRGGTEPPKKTA